MKKNCIIIVSSWLIFSCMLVSGQKTMHYDDPLYTYKLALDLFQKEKYAAARVKFEEVIESISDRQSLLRADAEYYTAVSATELKHPDAREKLAFFTDNHPEHAKLRMAYFYLGKSYYESKRYKNAAESFDYVSVKELDKKQTDDFYLMAGYSWFEEESFTKAKNAFSFLKDKEGPYKPYAIYYYAHISYIEKEYKEALEHFNKIKENENFNPLIPYYITDILYQQELYAELPEIVIPMLDDHKTKKMVTIARLIGDAYYKTNNYDLALPWFEKFVQLNTGTLSREDAYQTGYVFYQTGHYSDAATMFEKVKNDKDSLAQNAYYHLADCYLKTGDKRFALNAFLETYKLGLDKNITEDALYNYAKLSFDLELNPFNRAIQAFEQFIGDYPNSQHINNAQVLLIHLYLNTKNYKNALLSIEKIKDQSDNLKAAYQKITYFRAIELFNEEHYQESISLLKKSQQYSLDKETRAMAYYWEGEALYRIGEYEEARDRYNRYQVLPGAYGKKEYAMAHYNIGYTYFKEKNYPAALLSYKKFLMNTNGVDNRIINDAKLRTGDCYFISKEFHQSIKYYDEVAQSNTPHTDYALYQQSLSYGALGNFTKKAEKLNLLLQRFPMSSYNDESMYELAHAYEMKGDIDRALIYYNRLINEFSKSVLVKEALLKSALLHHSKGDYNNALTLFKRVFSEYRGTPESKEALVAVRDIYVELDRLPDYYEFIQTNNIVSSNNEEDSLTYITAEKIYMDGEFQKALLRFDEYLNQFPDGLFAINANFYKAECEYREKNYNKALAGYNFVTSRPRTKFTEPALYKAAKIYYDRNEYAKALDNYIRLELNADNRLYIDQGRIGMMRSYFHLKDYNNAMKVSKRLTIDKTIEDNIVTEAHLTLAKSALNIDSIVLAQTHFNMVLKRTKSIMAAEAKFNLAQIQYQMQNYDEAEKIVFELINELSSYDYWIARSFILLADIYVVQENTFQAKHTLESIINNYEGEELVKLAQQKLNTIIEKEREEEVRKAQKELEIDTIIPNPENNNF